MTEHSLNSAKISYKVKTADAGNDFFDDYSYNLKKILATKNEETTKKVSNLFDKTLQGHVRVKKQINI